jgi:tetratricopeptide (TPR) repeat protein
VVSGCSGDEPTTEMLLSRADSFFIAERYDQAEREYRSLLRTNPDDPVAIARLGIIYHSQGQMQQAYLLLKQALELQPDNILVQLKLGLTFFANREYDEARELALRILDKHPDYEEALLLLAETAISSEQIEESRKLIGDLRERDHDRPGYHLALGTLDLRQQNQEAAEDRFRAALGLDPQSSAAYALLGTLFWSRSDLAAADQAFKTASEYAPLRSSLRLRYAQFKLQTGAAAEAKKILEDVVRQAPDFLPPRVFLMKIACAEGRNDDCAARVQDILTQDRTNYEASFEDGVASLTKGDVEKAVRDFEYLSNTYTQNPLVRYQLALAYLQRAKRGSAIEIRTALEDTERCLSDALRLDSHFREAILLLAQLKITKGNPAAALNPLIELIKEKPQIVEAHYLLASAYLAQQNRAKALAVYQQMSEIFPQDPQPPFHIGRILLGQRQPAEARKAFERSIEIYADYLPAWEEIVDLDIAEERYTDAMDRVQKQIDKDPHLGVPWALRAKIYLAQRNLPRAEADLLQAIDRDPKLEAGYIALSQLYMVLKRPERAIEKLNAYTEKNKSVSVLMQLAMIHEQLKQFSAARGAYEVILGVQSSFAPALNNLAVLYSEHLGDIDAAHDLARKAREFVPNQPDIADTLGWILFKKGDYRNAARLLQESASQLPEHPEVQFHLGMSLYMLGEEETGRLALQKAANALGEFSGKDEARRRLAVLAIDVAAGDAADRNELEYYLRERPNDPVALYRRAQWQEREGGMDQAIKTYEKIVDSYPLFAPAIRRAALLYGRRADEGPNAYELTVRARQAFPQDPEITKTLGILSYRREYYLQAVDLLRESLLKSENNRELLYYLGLAHYQLSQWEQCKATLEAAFATDVTTKLATEARRALTECAAKGPA